MQRATICKRETGLTKSAREIYGEVSPSEPGAPMFQVGEMVLVRSTYELLHVKGVETKDGTTVYVYGREGRDNDRPFADGELSYPFGRK